MTPKTFMNSVQKSTIIWQIFEIKTHKFLCVYCKIGRWSNIGRMDLDVLYVIINAYYIWYGNAITDIHKGTQLSSAQFNKKKHFFPIIFFFIFSPVNLFIHSCICFITKIQTFAYNNNIVRCF